MSLVCRATIMCGHRHTEGKKHGYKNMTTYIQDEQQNTYLLLLSIQLYVKETKHLCLSEIKNLLQGNRKSLRDFPSMPYPIGYAANTHGNKLIYNEMAYDKELLHAEFNKYYHSLTCLPLRNMSLVVDVDLVVDLGLEKNVIVLIKDIEVFEIVTIGSVDPTKTQ
ncbi:hypothetical protein JHK85_000830 [Glycine max]|nr:hypothetical protein JHK85_000830 [Glycine max]